MKHEDSYIYLSSINGLAVMANVFPNTVIKTLVEEYEAMRTKKTMTDNNNSSAELKMKVGEVLVRVTKLLGEYCAVHFIQVCWFLGYNFSVWKHTYVALFVFQRGTVCSHHIAMAEMDVEMLVYSYIPNSTITNHGVQLCSWRCDEVEGFTC